MPGGGFCQHCGAANAGKFCGECGRPQPGVQARKDVDLEALQAQIKGAEDNVLFKGTTWPGWCFSPLCCRTVHWEITKRSIDWEHGCCQNDSDTIDMRRIKDVAYRRYIRGTVIIYADAELNKNEIRLTKNGAKELYYKIRKAWTDVRTSSAAANENN